MSAMERSVETITCPSQLTAMLNNTLGLNLDKTDTEVLRIALERNNGRGLDMKRIRMLVQTEKQSSVLGGGDAVQSRELRARVPVALEQPATDGEHRERHDDHPQRLPPLRRDSLLCLLLTGVRRQPPHRRRRLRHQAPGRRRLRRRTDGHDEADGGGAPGPCGVREIYGHYGIGRDARTGMY